MAPRPTIVEMSHVTPSPTGSDVTAGEMAAPFALTPTPPATPSPPPLQVPVNAPVGNGLPQHHQEHNNDNDNDVFHEEEPILPELHPFIPYPPYTSELEDAVPLNTNLPQVLRKVCGTDELSSVRQLRLRVISKDMSLQRLCLHVPNLRELTLDGSSLLSLRDLGCRLVHLRKLMVARCGLDSLDGLLGLMNLRELHAADNSIDDIGPCSVLRHIKRIDLSRNRVTDVSYLSFLRVCAALKHISLAGCPAAEDIHYRAEVRRRMPQLVSLDGEPLHRGAPGQDSADDSEDDSDDDKGGGVNDVSPFSSAGEDGGESDDGNPPYPGAGDAGRREMLPPLQHSMAPLPPLRPLHPLPPIGSRSRPASASAGIKSTSAIVAERRPNTGCAKTKAHRQQLSKRAEDASTDASEVRPQTDPSRVTSPSAPAGNVASGVVQQHREHGKQSEIPDRPAHKKMAAKQPTEDVQNGGNLAEHQPDRKPFKKLTQVDCLTLDMEERVRRWTDEILDNPALENLEEKMTLIAAEDGSHPADDEDDDAADDKPGPSGTARRK